MKKVCLPTARTLGLVGILSLASTGVLAQSTENGSELSLLLRLQTELVQVDGAAADAAGTDGFDVTDGWANGRSNSGNWGALFVDGAHQINSNTRVFARFGLNINADGLVDGSGRNREVYAGVAGDFGKIYAGRIESAYKVSGMSWDPLNATFMQARGNIGRSFGAYGHGGFFNRSLAYENTFGKVKFHAVASLDDAVPGDIGNDDDHVISAAISAPMGPVEFIAAYIDGSNYKGGPDDREAIKVGARYSKDQWSGAIMHEARMEGLEDGNFTFVTGTYRQNKWQFSANVGLFNDDNGSNDSNYFALGARYQLHNRASIHGGIRQLDRDLTGKERIAGLGLRILLNSGNLFK